MTSADTEHQDESTSQLVAAPIALTRQLEQLVDKRINILRRIHETGSISEAARLSNVSYKAAWQALETLTNLAGVPLVEKEVGGSKGGGTKLTASGLTVLELSEKLTRAREAVLMEFASRVTPELVPLSSATLRTSMRNQFPVTVMHIARGPALVRVHMRIDDVNTLKATLTQESAQLLGLNQGERALALFKATSVEIAHRVEPVKGSSVISGTVIRSARQDKYEELCEHCSAMEQLAASAERASIKYKQVEFMSDKLGQVFEGTVSGVTEFGLYVEINENKCEGMVPLRDLDDDYYEFDERNYCLWGRKYHHRYSLGDTVQVKVAKANLEKKQLDYALVRE